MSQPRISPRKLLIALIVGAVVIALLAVVYVKVWPFSREAVLQDLREASDSSVSAVAFHPTYFPRPGCIIEGLVFRHGSSRDPLITIQKLIVQGSYLGILRRHVPRIIAIGSHISVPPFGNNEPFKTQHSNTVVDEIVANGTVVEFESPDNHSQPLRFDVHEAVLTGVRWDKGIGYKLRFRNPEPPGELSVTGSFGNWITGHPEKTQLSGDYTFEHADLGVYGGIAGLLSSKGRFEGVLSHVNISGTTDIPDFEVRSGDHKVKLSTRFDAYVDATRGDTFLNKVEAQFGRTTLVAEGSVAGSAGHKGKFASFRLISHHGRIEDVLGLFVTERAPMSGAVSLRAHAEIPPGDQAFLKKVRLDGAFGIDEGSFSKPETQKDVNELSAGARGEKKDEPETVLTDLKGSVSLVGGVAQFSDLTFGIPGAKARMHGTYNIMNHRIDLHGRMRVETKISKTASGAKALMLKIMDPIFKKKKKGEIVPVHIAGTYEKPQFGLDLNQPGNKPGGK